MSASFGSAKSSGSVSESSGSFGSEGSGSDSSSSSFGSEGCDCAAFTEGNDYGSGTWRSAATLDANGGDVTPTLVAGDQWYLVPGLVGEFLATGYVEFTVCGLSQLTLNMVYDNDETSALNTTQLYLNGVAYGASFGPSGATQDGEIVPIGADDPLGRKQNVYPQTINMTGCTNVIRIQADAYGIAGAGNTTQRLDITGVTYS